MVGIGFECSSGFADVEVQHSTVPRPADDLAARPFLTRRAGLPLNQLPAQPLMKPFPMIVGHEFLEHVAEMSLTEKHLSSSTSSSLRCSRSLIAAAIITMMNFNVMGRIDGQTARTWPASKLPISANF